LKIKPKKGIWKYEEWLPVNRALPTEEEMRVYKSHGLARELELENLHIAFNGYYPERNASLKTVTFKELEAPPTVARALDNNINCLVLASAGNTARSFAYLSVLMDFNIVLVIPPEAQDKIWIPTDREAKHIHLIMLSGNSDYFDAISFASEFCNISQLMSEGGARNVARRDGMGIVMLEAVTHIGRMPDHYIQSVGSGTGGIAAYEASLRLIQDGRFGFKLPKLQLIQNKPFTPMVDAWKQKSRHLLLTQKKTEDILRNVKSITANVLANRRPPYPIPGGVFDCLMATNGDMYGVSNDEALSAGKLFESAEEIDVVPAAAVGIAGLIKLVEEEKVKRDDVIVLNVTGGGLKRAHEDLPIQYIEPKIITEEPEQAYSQVFESLEIIKHRT
jgi:cysteate synthase